MAEPGSMDPCGDCSLAKYNRPAGSDCRLLDCVVDPTEAIERQAAAYVYFDGTNVYFRIILDGDPLSYTGPTSPNGLRPFGWAAMIESTGDIYPDYGIGIDGTGASDRIHTMYNEAPALDLTLGCRDRVCPICDSDSFFGWVLLSYE